MIDERDGEELAPEVAAALRALRQEEDPPPQLYQRVTGELRARGLIRTQASRPWPLFTAIAGLAAGLAIGFFGGRLGVEAESTPPKTPSFALFLMASSAVHYPDSASDADRVEMYRRWARPLAEAGRLSLGEELVPRRYLVDSSRTTTVAADGAIDGMFVVSAPSVDSAISLAATLPHVRYGGAVMVQEIARR